MVFSPINMTLLIAKPTILLMFIFITDIPIKQK